MDGSSKSSSHFNDGKNGKKEKTRRGAMWMEKIPKFEKGDMKHSLVSESSFQTKFPQYRETYLKESFPLLKKIMSEHGIKVELDTNNGSISVTTTNKTWDPYAILLARDAIKLLSRHVTIEKAIQVFEEGIVSEIVEIKKMCRDQETFKKRRNRLMGKDNAPMIALEKLTKCSVTLQGGTAAIIGPHKGVIKALGIVKDCMKNVHPLYLLNSLFIQNTLSEDPNMKNEDWSRMLPQYKAKTVQKKKKKIVRKEYNPMPPSQLESKLDQKLIEGEVFVSRHLLKRTKLSKEEQKAKSDKIQAAKRAQQYIAPVERVSKKRKREETEQVDIKKLKKKVSLQKKKLAGIINTDGVERSVKKGKKKLKLK